MHVKCTEYFMIYDYFSFILQPLQYIRPYCFSLIYATMQLVHNKNTVITNHTNNNPSEGKSYLHATSRMQRIIIDWDEINMRCISGEFDPLVLTTNSVEQRNCCQP